MLRGDGGSVSSFRVSRMSRVLRKVIPARTFLLWQSLHALKALERRRDWGVSASQVSSMDFTSSWFRCQHLCAEQLHLAT